MKFLERFTLILFANIILIFSVVLCTVLFGWLDIEILNQMFSVIVNNPTATKICIGVSVVFMLLAIKAIFFGSAKKIDNKKEGVLLENANGKLLVSKEALENLVTSVVREIEGATKTQIKVEFDKEQNVSIFVTLFVEQNVVIKDISNKLQVKIKDTVQKSMDLNIKEVNISVKNIVPKEEVVSKEV